MVNFSNQYKNVIPYNRFFAAEIFIEPMHDKLTFEGSIFLLFHLLASWVNTQFSFEEFYFCGSYVF